MNKSDIITALYKSKEVAEAIGKMQPVELQEDLKQELFTHLCELPEEKIVDMHSNGWLKFYFIRVMLNMIKSKTSPFYKTYRKHNCISLIDNIPSIDDGKEQAIEKDKLLQDLVNEFGGEQWFTDLTSVSRGGKLDHWYEQRLFKLYIMYNRNVSALSRGTKINRTSIVDTIQTVKAKIKNKLNRKRTKFLVMIPVWIEAPEELCPDSIVDVAENISMRFCKKVKKVKKIEKGCSISEIGQGIIKQIIEY